MKNGLLILAMATFLLSSCVDGLNPRKNVLIRIQNNSTAIFEDIVVNTSGGIQEYGNLAPNLTSIYKDFDLAYEFAYIELTANGVQYTLQPIDYVGEEQLENGKYTYCLMLDNSNGSNVILIEFKED